MMLLKHLRSLCSFATRRGHLADTRNSHYANLEKAFGGGTLNKNRALLKLAPQVYVTVDILAQGCKPLIT